MRRKPMRVDALQVQDVAHGLAPRDQRVGNELPVAAPRHALGAHDGGRAGRRDFAQPGEGALKFRAPDGTVAEITVRGRYKKA